MGHWKSSRPKWMKQRAWDRAQAGMDAYGVLRFRDLWGAGVRSCDLFFLTFVGGIRHLGAGLYVRSHLEPTPAVLAARRINHGTLCLLSALHFHGILDRAPERVWVAIPRSQRRPLPLVAPLEIIRVRSDLHFSGATLERVGGVRVLVTTLVRTAVDCLRFRRKVGIDFARSVLRKLLDDGFCSSDELLLEARRCRVFKAMRQELSRIRPALGEIFRSERRATRRRRPSPVGMLEQVHVPIRPTEPIDPCPSLGEDADESAPA